MWPLGMFDRFVDVVEHGTNLVADSWAYSSVFIGVERILDLRGHRVPTGLAVTWRDVTDRHNAALQLAESESRYRRLAENVDRRRLRGECGRRDHVGVAERREGAATGRRPTSRAHRSGS